MLPTQITNHYKLIKTWFVTESRLVKPLLENMAYMFSEFCYFCPYINIGVVSLSKLEAPWDVDGCGQTIVQ